MLLKEQGEADLTELIWINFLLTFFRRFYVLSGYILIFVFDMLFSEGSGHFYSSIKHSVCPELTGDCHSYLLYG